MNSSRYFDNDLHESGIAIVGMSGRFPGAKTVVEFWNNLCEGKIALKQYTKKEINDAIAAHDYASIPHLMKQVNSGTWVGAGFHLDDADKFDAEFFSYTPSEAELLDPQQRLFLESAWAAMEDAGYIPDEYPGSVGIFGGANLSRYFLYNIFSNREIMYSTRDLTAGIGNEPDYVTNRVAYKLNLKGPSVSVQTACSTSLVAIHMASQALHAGECDFCLAGGVMVNAPGSAGYLYQEGSMTSPDGNIRTFDKDASGTVFSEGGVGVVCLKRIEDAVNDGDHIYGVLIGSAVGNDGIHKAGYTAPGVDGQVEVISEALEVADISPRQISYVEAHGTGTPLGDPIEVNALTRAYRKYTRDNQYCALASLKPNVGHLAPAAGVASVIKVSLALKHSKLPPSVNYRTANPQIDFDSSPFYVNTELSQWQSNDKRIAAVSSFGIGGTNAHVIIEEAPEERPRDEFAKRVLLLPFSAKTVDALNGNLRNMREYLQHESQTDLRDIAHTLRVGRKQFKRRACVAADSVASLVNAIDQTLDGQHERAVLDADEKLVFMFSGQGSQYLNMCRDLYQSQTDEFKVFRNTLDDCFERFATASDLDLKTIVFSDTGESGEQLRETRVVQPLLFMFELALAKQLLAFNLPASAMIGHSIGEYVAAHLAGVFDLETALYLVRKRGELMQSMPSGAMVSVPLGVESVEQYLNPELSLAADNAPENTVVSGSHEQIDSLLVTLAKEGISGRKLMTSHAFHSHMMTPILKTFEEIVSQVELRVPQQAYISNVTGTWIEESEATSPTYWAQHLAGTVNFRPGIETLLEEGYRCFIEVGPGNALSTFSKRALVRQKKDGKTLQLVRHVKETEADTDYLRNALKKMWCMGVSLDWQSISPLQNARRISLPGYAFQRKRHWVDAKKSLSDNLAQQGKREDLSSWMYVPSWKRQARLAKPNLASLKQRKVLLLSEQPLESLAAVLEEHCSLVVLASQGSSFEQLPGGRFKLNFGEPEHYSRLLVKVDCDTVIYASCLAPFKDTVVETAEQEQQLVSAFYSPLFLYQALGELPAGRKVMLLSLSSALSDVLPNEKIQPLKSLLQGIHLCGGQEYPAIKGKNIDFAATENAQEPGEQMLQCILNELAVLSGLKAPLVSMEEKFIAYREGYRWCATIEAQPLPECTRLSVSPEGTYLITGGLGGLGLEFAEHLVEQGAKRLALVGRSSFPDNAEWDAWLEHYGREDATSRKIIKLRELQKRGTVVRVFSADICSLGDAQKLIANIELQCGNIQGVIHSAGVAGSGVMQLKNREQAEKVIAPKVKGTLALEAALEGRDPDFVILFSSLFSIIGGVGQVDYSAANSFLDSYARQQRNTQARPVVSINWGGFSEVGMAVDPGVGGAAKLRSSHPATDVKNARHPWLHTVERRQNSVLASSYLSHQELWALQEHRVAGRGAMPGTALLEIIAAAFKEAFPEAGNVLLENVYFLGLLTVSEDEWARVDFEFQRLANGGYIFECFRELDSTRSSFVSGDIRVQEETAPAIDLPEVIANHQLESLKFPEGQSQVLATEGFLELGPRWQVLQELHFAQNSLLAHLRLHKSFVDDLAGLYWHPALLDMATGPVTGHLLATLNLDLEGEEYLPFSYGKLVDFLPLPDEIYSHICFQRFDENQKTLHFDIHIYDREGNGCLSISDFVLKRVPAATPGGKEEKNVNFMDDSTSPQEGRAIFNRIMENLEQPQWIVSTQDLPALIARVREGVVESLDTRQRDKNVMTRDDDSYVAARNPVEQNLVYVFENVLGITPVGVHDNFFDLGADSVSGIQIVSHAKAKGIILKPDQLFKHQTIAELAEVASRSSQAAPPTTGGEYSELQLAAMQISNAPQQWNWLTVKSTQSSGEELEQRARMLLERYSVLKRQRNPEGGFQELDTPRLPTEIVETVNESSQPLQQTVKKILPEDSERLARFLYLPADGVVVFAVHKALGLDLNAIGAIAGAFANPESLTESELPTRSEDFDFEQKEAEALFYKKLQKTEAWKLEHGENKEERIFTLPLKDYAGFDELGDEYQLNPEHLVLLATHSTLLELQSGGADRAVNLLRSRAITIDEKQGYRLFAVPVRLDVDVEKSVFRRLIAIRTQLEQLPRAGLSWSLYAGREGCDSNIFVHFLGSIANDLELQCHLDASSLHGASAPAGTGLVIEAGIVGDSMQVRLEFNGVACDTGEFSQVFHSCLEQILLSAIKERKMDVIPDCFTAAELSDEDFATLIDEMSEGL